MAFEEKISLVWRHCVVVFVLWIITSTGLRMSRDQTVWVGGGGMLIFFETVRKETGLLLESSGECVWENLCGPLESPQRDGVEDQSRALTMGERNRSL